jgi:hypothetical protein
MPAEGFHIASAWVDVVPETTGFGEKTQAELDAELSGVTGKVKLSADDRTFRKHIDTGIAKVRELDSLTARPKVELDDDGFAARVDEDTGKIRALGSETARPKVDSSSVRDAGGWMGLLVTAATAVAPAAITAGVGLGAFGALAIPTLKDAVTGTNELHGGLLDLEAEYGQVADSVRPEVVQAFNTALDQADHILPKLTGTAIAGGDALNGFLGQFGSFLQGGTAQEFAHFIEDQAGPDLHSLGNLLDGAASGAMGLTQALNPLAKALVNTVGGVGSLIGDTARAAPDLTSMAVAATGLYLAGQKLAGTKAGTWLTESVKGLPQYIQETTAAAAVDRAMAASVGEQTAALAGFAVAADGTTVAVSEMTAAESASAVAMGALEAVSPVGWAVAGAAAIAALGDVLVRHSGDVQADISAMQQQDNATGFNVAGYQRLAAQLDVTGTSQTKLGAEIRESAGPLRLAKDGSAAYAVAQGQVSQAQLAAQGHARNLTTNLSQLQTMFGLTRTQAEGLAASAGVSGDALAAGGTKAQGAMRKIEQYATAGAQAATVTTQLAVDFSMAANNAASLTDRTNALTNAYNALVSPLTSVIGDTVTLKQGNASLAAALKKSGDQTGYATKAQQDSSRLMADAVNNTLNLSEATLQNTGSASKAGGVLRAEISVLEKLGAKGSVAAELLRKLKAALDALHSKTVNIGVHVEETTTGASVRIPGGMSGTTMRASMATGGVLPGYAPGVDDVPLMASRGEGILVPEAVRGLGPGFVEQANRVFGGARVARGNKTGHYAGGGVVDRFSALGDQFNISVTLPAATQAVVDRLGSTAPGPKQTAKQRAAEAAAARVKAFEDAGKKLADAFASGSLKTLSQIKTEAADAIGEIRKYYSGTAQTRLVGAIRTQTTALEHLATQSATIQSKITAERAYAANITTGLAGYSDLSGVTPLTGGTARQMGTNLASQLGAKLATLQKFYSLLGQLKRAGVDKALIAQVVALGPDEGVQYAQAILSGGRKLISELNSEESKIGSLDTSIGKRATEIQYGQSITTGFLSSLRAKEAELKKEMGKLGDEIARELARDFNLPLKDVIGLSGGGSGKRKMTHLSESGKGVSVTINYNGTQHPTAEQKAEMKRDLALLLSGG